MRWQIAKVLICISTFMVVLAPYVQATEHGCKNYQNDLLNAHLLLKQRRFWEAEAIYERLLPFDDTGDAHLGLFYSLDGQSGANFMDRAELILRSVREKSPDRAESLAAAGYLAYRAGFTTKSGAKRDRYMEASGCLCELAIKKKPEFLQPFLILCLAEVGMFDYQRASKCFDKAIEQCHKLSKANSQNKGDTELQTNINHHYCIARIGIYFGDLRLVEREFKTIIRLLGVDDMYYPDLRMIDGKYQNEEAY